MSKVKLKTGWFKTSNSAVYENKRGERIHTQGLLRTAKGFTNPPDTITLRKFLDMTGGNRRRALMACMEIGAIYE